MMKLFLSFVNNQKEHTRNPKGSGSTVIKCIKTPIVHLRKKLHFLLILDKVHKGEGGGEQLMIFTIYFAASFFTLLLGVAPSMSIPASSFTSFLILSPPCSQASGVYQVRSATCFVVTFVLPSVLRSSSSMVVALNWSRHSRGPRFCGGFLFPPIVCFQSMNCSLLWMY